MFRKNTINIVVLLDDHRICYQKTILIHFLIRRPYLWTDMDFLLHYESDLPHIVYSLLALLLLIQLYYILFVYGKLALFKVRQNDLSDENLPPVTIILCAYNEQKNLKKYLPLLLGQDYPIFEIIVVDDCSNDDSKWVLKEYSDKHENIRVIEIKEHIQLKHSKKFALTIGIKGAKYNHLVMIDADCKASSTKWLREIASGFTEGKEIVLGYSPYFKRKGLLNKFIRFETSHTAMSYLSYALKRNTYMGVGRNLAYTKDLFFKGKGFNAHMHIKSGDDDLFVNHNATKHNVNISIHPDSHIYSVPKSNWKEYNKQKARHSTASVAYRKKHQRTLALQLTSAVLFYVMLAVSALIYPEGWPYLIGIYLVRLLAQVVVYRSCFKKLNTLDLIWWLPLLDMIFYFYISLNGLFNRHKKQISWT